MASEQNSIGVNGNYASTQIQGYSAGEQNFNTMPISNSSVTASSEYNAVSTSQNTGSVSSSEIPKDEVGWYFVEQYYTTLSRNPDKLFLFYNKKSQFVSGNEAEKVPVSVGQKAINDRIRELDIQDCKVRVTNVDSQGSGSNIVIQVIGEISNKATPHRKFTQTFVLAEQLNGYFVLNDIFRYIAEEDAFPQEEEVTATLDAKSGSQEPPATVADTIPQTLTSSENKEEQEHDAGIVDEELQEVIKEEPSLAVEAPSNSANDVNGDVSEPIPATPELEAEPANHVEPEASQDADEPVETAPPVVTEPEKPKDPEPTPAQSPPPKAEAAAETSTAPPKPSAPKTWANLVAGGKRVVTPVTPAIPAATTPQAATAPKTAPVTSPSTSTPVVPSISTGPVSSTTTSTAETDNVETPQSAASEWQTAGHDHGKKQTRGQATQVPLENSRGYIKNVSESIDPPTLRAVLTKVAEVTYLDINRQKNCAFVDFATPSGYQAAVAGNPHEVNGERLFVEERRIRPANFSPFAGPRGGGGRPGGQGRGAFQGKEGGRGGFPNRGRGIGAAGRGRGAAPTAA